MAGIPSMLKVLVVALVLMVIGLLLGPVVASVALAADDRWEIIEAPWVGVQSAAASHRALLAGAIALITLPAYRTLRPPYNDLRKSIRSCLDISGKRS